MVGSWAPGAHNWPSGGTAPTGTPTGSTPVLAVVAVDRLTSEHCAMVFQRVDMFNEELETAHAAGRKPELPGDVRSRARYTGVATQHRIYAALRAFLNHAWKKTHQITFNPI